MNFLLLHLVWFGLVASIPLSENDFPFSLRAGNGTDKEVFVIHDTLRPDFALAPVLSNGSPSRYRASITWDSLDEIDSGTDVFDDEGVVFNSSQYLGSIDLQNPPGGWSADYEHFSDREVLTFSATIAPGVQANYQTAIFNQPASVLFSTNRSGDTSWNYTLAIAPEEVKFSWTLTAGSSAWDPSTTVLQLASTLSASGLPVFGSVDTSDPEKRVSELITSALVTKLATLKFGIMEGAYLEIGVATPLDFDNISLALQYIQDTCPNGDCEVPTLFQFPAFEGEFDYDPSIDVLLVADDEVESGEDGGNTGDGGGDDKFGTGGIIGVVVGSCMALCVLVFVIIVCIAVVVAFVVLTITGAISSYRMRSLATKHMYVLEQNQE